MNKKKLCASCGSEDNPTPKRPGKHTGSYCRTCKASRMRAYMGRKKLKVFEHYGNKCACCGEKEFLFLTIDHVNNDGNLHRWAGGSRITGGNLYIKVVGSGYPDDYQILCMNCNFGKRMNGGICPHVVVE